MSGLTGKVAVITGGSSGIGLAIAKRFVDEGAQVYITGRRREELDNALERLGPHAVAIPGDVRRLEDLDRVYAEVKSKSGVIDVVVANAGIIEQRRLADTSAEDFDKTFEINARGVYFTVQKALPLLRAGGSIIVVSSIAAEMGFPAHGTYSATKAAVRSFVRTWTAELKDRGIRVNAISPGPIETPIIAGQASSPQGAEEIRASFSSAIPLGRMGRPEEVANAAYFLASDEGSFVAGVDLAVDGGMRSV
jgi:NAD(P)-dependent dehydrogenase (short-subunit alcohol dehydrogenase family)